MMFYIGDVGRRLLKAADELKLARLHLDTPIEFYGHYYQALEIFEDLSNTLSRQTTKVTEGQTHG